MRPSRKLRSWLTGLTFALTFAGLPGCGGGGEPETPPMDSAQFEADKKAYQEVRRSERGEKVVLPGDPVPAKKKGR